MIQAIELAHGGVGIGVCRAGNGNHGREFGVAEASERADNGHQDQRDRDGGSGAGTASHGGMMDQIIAQRRVEKLDGVELLAGDGGANYRENAGADDRADAERRERPRAQGLLQTRARVLPTR